MATSTVALGGLIIDDLVIRVLGLLVTWIGFANILSSTQLMDGIEPFLWILDPPSDQL